MKRIFCRSFLILTLVVSAIILIACHRPPPPPPTKPHPLTPYQRSLVSQIRTSGTRVIQQGDVLQIIMPTDTFFRRNTTRLKRHKTRTVKRVAALIKSYVLPYRHPRIRVTGYTDRVFARMTRKKLSTQYAREIAAYLWHAGISQRYLRVRGGGAASPIASNQTPRGSAYNRRVVIQIH